MPNAQSWGHREWPTPMNLSGRNWAVTIESGQIIWSNEFAKKMTKGASIKNKFL